MSRNIPLELDTSINQQVLKCLDGLSAHSDVAEALTTALEPLGDVQVFCPDSQHSRVGSTIDNLPHRQTRELPSNKDFD